MMATLRPWRASCRGRQRGGKRGEAGGGEGKGEEEGVGSGLGRLLALVYRGDNSLPEHIHDRYLQMLR